MNGGASRARNPTAFATSSGCATLFMLLCALLFGYHQIRGYRLLAVLLGGLVANAVGGWWWADPVAALFMVPWLVREGLEALEGEEEGE